MRRPKWAEKPHRPGGLVTRVFWRLPCYLVVFITFCPWHSLCVYPRRVVNDPLDLDSERRHRCTGTRWLAATIAAAGVLLLALSGQGQDTIGLAGRGESLRLRLLSTPEVQKELKLSQQQVAKIDRFAAEFKTAKKEVESARGKGRENVQPKTKSVDPMVQQQERIAGGDRRRSR